MSGAERIEAALRYVAADDRDTWVRMAMAVKSELGGDGFELWDNWSRSAKSYDAGSARAVWKSASPGGGITIGTLFHEAKANGWSDDGTYQRPSTDQIEARRIAAAERAEREAGDRARERAEAAGKAAAIWKAATSAGADHPYLLRKQVAPVTTLRELDAAAVATILGYPPKSRGEPLAGRLLVVPVKIGADLSTLELIDGDGRKSALAGGAKAGGYWSAQALPAGDGDGLRLLIGEGAATVLSARSAADCPAIAALASGNLVAVAKAMRQRYPAAELVILADLVKATGEPDPHAVAAGSEVGAMVAVPTFGDDRQGCEKDFNDLQQRHGGDAVRRAIDAALRRPKTTTEGGKKDAPPPWTAPAEIGADEWNAARGTPDCIVENLLFADVATLVAPGGMGKTTLILFAAVHIALGRPLFGLEVRRPGPVLLLTAEDSREMLVARLRHIADAMELTDDEKARVRSDVRISDVSGCGMRLTAVYDEVVMPVGRTLDAIIAGCRELRPVLIVIDPAVSFGVGESRVNDAEQGLIEAARRLRNALNCCVEYVHHTGKQNGRDGAVDQYAGRGGSAFADGSRMVSVLASVSPEDWTKETGEPLAPGETGLRLARPKLSYTPPQPDILIHRSGYRFQHVEAIGRDAGPTIEAQANQVWQLLNEELRAGRRHSRNSLEAVGVEGMKRDRIRAALGWLEASGRIEERPQPSKQRGGARTYLHPVEFASPFGSPSLGGDMPHSSVCLANEQPVFASPTPIGKSTAANQTRRVDSPLPDGSPDTDGEPMANLANQTAAPDDEVS